jgi:hypothetical protein
MSKGDCRRTDSEVSYGNLPFLRVGQSHPDLPIFKLVGEGRWPPPCLLERLVVHLSYILDTLLQETDNTKSVQVTEVG